MAGTEVENHGFKKKSRSILKGVALIVCVRKISCFSTDCVFHEMRTFYSFLLY
jgi:hypothetical protein